MQILANKITPKITQPIIPQTLASKGKMWMLSSCEFQIPLLPLSLNCLKIAHYRT